MRQSLLFYISGHGYGHARRMTQVIRELISVNPDIGIHVRSAASPRVFEPLPREWIQSCDIDAGLVEKDALIIDREKSLERLITFMSRRDSIVAQETAVVRQLKPRLIVADIPFLAGDVAAGAGVPCIGISNFTWDWIYENLFGDDPSYATLADSIAKSYSKYSSLLQLPFGKTCPAIPSKTDVPLIALQSHREPATILAQLGIAHDDRRPRVLIGTRGSLSPGVLAKAADDAGEFLFLCPHETADTMPANGISIPLGPKLDFSDVLKISNVVISKLGYGMISECIYSQTRLVWPPRDGFVEDEVVAERAPNFVPMLRMPLEAYQSGEWGIFLREAMQLPASWQQIPTTGAATCAALLLRSLETET